MVSQANKSQTNATATSLRRRNNETDSRSIRSSVGTLSNRIRPWKREARDGHGYQHLRQLHYRGGYIKENDHGDGKRRDKVKKEWLTGSPERSQGRRKGCDKSK